MGSTAGAPEPVTSRPVPARFRATSTPPSSVHRAAAHRCHAIRCDRCERAFPHLGPAAQARVHGWDIDGALTLCPACATARAAGWGTPSL